MSIGAGGMRSVVSRAQEVERTQRVEQDASKLQQQNFARELATRAEERTRQVGQSPRPEGAQVEKESIEKNDSEEKPEVEEDVSSDARFRGKRGSRRPKEPQTSKAGTCGGEEGKGLVIDVEV